MGRTSFHRRVFTACLVTFTGIFMQCSWSCDPLEEPTDLKAYRSAIVVEGTLVGSTAFVERKTMKGQFPSRVSDIQLRGFASEDPCTGPVSSFSLNTTYLLFINETSDEGVYKLMANPEESSRTSKRTVRKVVKDGKWWKSAPDILILHLPPQFCSISWRNHENSLLCGYSCLFSCWNEYFERACWANIFIYRWIVIDALWLADTASHACSINFGC